jgi:thiamine biosynthesis lipoprotein
MSAVRCLLRLAACGLAIGGTLSSASLVRHEAQRLSMACVYDIAAYGDASGDVPGVLEKALDEVDRIDRLMSHYKPDSPLSELNRRASAGPVAVDPELYDFIARSLEHSRASGGAFDITVGPLMKAWGFFDGDYRVPTDAELDDARGRVGHHRVILDPVRRTIRFETPGVELDLGGIAKGYAVDRAVAVLKQHGITAALVSAGGSTIYGLGHPPDRRSWEVRVQDPANPARIAFSVEVVNGALSMAGRAGKSFEADATLYSHIMDPRTGRPVQGILSVAIMSPTGTDGDALDDAVFVMGVERGRSYLRRFPASRAWVWLAGGDGAAGSVVTLP